jgi:hypothetical protein
MEGTNADLTYICDVLGHTVLLEINTIIRYRHFHLKNQCVIGFEINPCPLFIEGFAWSSPVSHSERVPGTFHILSAFRAGIDLTSSVPRVQSISSSMIICRNKVQTRM